MAVVAAGAEAFDPALAAPSPSGGVPASRKDVQAAIAKAVELRQLHAALLQRGGAPNNAPARAAASRSPAVIRLPPLASPRAAADHEEYPVFTPAYEDEECVGAVALNHICQDNRSRSENWTGGVAALQDHDDAAVSDYDGGPGLHAFFSSSNSEVLFPSSTDHRLRYRDRGTATAAAAAAYKIHPAFMHSADRFFLASAGRAPAPAYKTTSDELKLPPATCGNAAFRSRPDTISGGRAPPPSSAAHSRTTTTTTKQILSWLFPNKSSSSSRKKKANKPEPEPTTTMSPTAIERGNMPRLVTEWGALQSLESLRNELAEAHAHRDAALREAADVRSSLGDLATKLASVEAYCSELKKALRQATSSPSSVSRRSTTRSVEFSREREVPTTTMPVSHEVMVEGFLQIASEARLSVKQLCKALIQQVSSTDESSSSGDLSDKLNLLLRPYQLALISNSKHSSNKAVLYHLEAIMNQAMFQDFENPAFQRNGAAPGGCLDPAEARRRSFAAFVALRNLSWNEVLRKGTKYYSEGFSRFCDRKMSAVVATLGWTRPWPEQLLQCFFVASKCVWLLHLLAFSFAPPLAIMRVEDGRAFEEVYMEDILVHDRQRKQQVQSSRADQYGAEVQDHGHGQVKIMVMPGFYVQDRVLKCRVLTTRSVSAP